MSSAKSGYLLGVGSNINPEINIANILRSLLEHFGRVSISRVLKIPPVGMNSHHDFLNMAVFIETSLNELELKTVFNDIETELGRDRTDPASKIKDRPADIDILLKVDDIQQLNQPASRITDEYFLYPLIDEVSAHLLNKNYFNRQCGFTINAAGLSFGQSASTIDWDTYSGQKRIS